MIPLQSRESLTAAVTTLLAAGAADGSLRADVAPADILASLSGVSLAAGAPEQRDQAGRLLDLLLDGLRRSRRPAELTRTGDGPSRARGDGDR